MKSSSDIGTDPYDDDIEDAETVLPGEVDRQALGSLETAYASEPGTPAAPARVAAGKRTPIPTAAAAFLKGTRIGIGETVGEFEITGLLGRGGMGTVYAGKHKVIGKKVAIKIIKEELSRDSISVQRFIQEARAVNAIESAHLIDIFAIGELEDGRSYFVMELLDGESLRERMERPDKIEVQVALDIIAQIARARSPQRTRQVSSTVT